MDRIDKEEVGEYFVTSLGGLLEQQTSRRAMRVLVQHTKDHEGWCYLLVAYADNRTYPSVKFNTISDLVTVMRRVAPDFLESSVAIDQNADRSYIAFSADWQLNDDQLFLLGLNTEQTRLYRRPQISPN